MKPRQQNETYLYYIMRVADWIPVKGRRFRQWHKNVADREKDDRIPKLYVYPGGIPMTEDEIRNRVK